MTSFSENAAWIWCGDTDRINTYVNFHETLLAEAGRRYILKISAFSDYALFVNGVYTVSGQYQDYPFFKVYDETDITDALSEGENRLLIIGYCQNEDSSTCRKEPAGILYTVSCDGEEVLFSSGKTLACPNPNYTSGPFDLVSQQTGFTFSYDATKEENALRNASVLIGYPETLSPRPLPKLKTEPPVSGTLREQGVFREGLPGTHLADRMQNAFLAFTDWKREGFDPEGITYTEESVKEKNDSGIFLIYDYGKETAGLPYIDITVPHECDILIGWGEHLDDLHIRAYRGGHNFMGVYHAHAGDNRFIHPFRRIGMRYMQFHVYAESVTVRYAGILPTPYVPKDNLPFPLRDPLHEKIYEVSKHTLLLCMHEHYEDTPWREQALYTMDSRNQMLCGYYCFRETAMPRESLRLLGLSIRKDGMLELCAPGRVHWTIPCYSAVYLSQLYEYLLFSGDKDFPREMLPVAERIAGAFLARTDKNGLLTCFAEEYYWNFYEWQEGSDGDLYGSVAEEDLTYDLPLQAFVTLGIRDLAKICRLLGEEEKAERYTKAADAMRRAGEIFFCPDRGQFCSYIRKRDGERCHYSRLSNSLALLAGFCSEDKADALLDQIAYTEDLLPVSLSHSIYRYDALMLRPEKYGSLIFREVEERFGRMLLKDSTTFWETDDGGDAFGFCGSLCHGWSAVPVYLYFRYALGLKIKEDGSGEFEQAERTAL